MLERDSVHAMDGATEILSIALLGDVTITLGPTRCDVALPRAALNVLGYLCYFRGEPLKRDRVAFAVWPDETEAGARANLRRQLHTLRALLPLPGRVWLAADARVVGIDAAVACDVDAFVRGTGRSHARRAALARYRGDFLSDIDAQWLEEPRRRLREHFFASALPEARELLAMGDGPASAALAQRMLDIDPWREDAVRLLLQSRAASDDRAGALGFYRDFAARLRGELDASPEPQTVRAYERIANEPDAEREIVAPNRVPLPEQLSRFINRERELATVSGLIQSNRVVTLSGPGGVGKSRLAAEVARAYARTREAVYVALGSALDDRRSIEARFCEGFGIAAADDGALAVIARFVGTRPVLIVVDNADRVTATTADLAVELLGRCSGLRLLITSQQRLHVDGEQVFAVAPLGVPAGSATAADIVASEAARLFVDRARSIDATFEVAEAHIGHLASICRRLDGVPLAIELAAARTSVLSLAEIDARLSDRFELLRSKSSGAMPQRALKTALDWSYDLLDAAERLAFRRLGVFAQGWTLESATAVLATMPGDHDALDVLTGLIDKSLASANAERSWKRYRFLESVRMYAAERLETSGELAEARHAAFAYFSDFVHRSALASGTPAEKSAFDAIASEHGNILAMLDIAIANAAVAVATTVACDLVPFWLVRGLASEGSTRLDALVANSAAIDDRLRARLLGATSQIHFRRGSIAEADGLAARALAVARVTGEDRLIADALLGTARCTYSTGRLDESRRSLEEALQRYEAAADALGQARVLNFLGILADADADIASGRTRLERSLALYEACGDLQGVALVNYHLGFGFLVKGEWAESVAFTTRALEIWVEHENFQCESWAQYNLAWAESRLGLCESATRRHYACLRTAYRFGFERELENGLDRVAELTMARDPHLAVRCLAHASRRRETHAVAVFFPERHAYEETLRDARERLPSPAFEAAWRAGRDAETGSLVTEIARLVGAISLTNTFRS